MHLRSGIFYRSGHSNRVDRQSGISTQESTARTPNQVTPIAEERTDSETESNFSMDTSSSVPMRTQGIELEYDGTLRFHMTNAHGARIYRDFISRFAVRVEDHSSPVNPAPRVNYQGDRYMDRHGVMYLLVEDPEVVDVLGNLVDKENGLIEEGPPKIEQQGLRLINSIWTRRVPIDDATKALYKREDACSEFFYLRDFPPLQ